jgi:hypothetical protein
MLNASFFLLIITLTFGFMSGVEHKALAQFFIASPVLSLIPITVWFVYLLKVINFNRSRLVLSENYFMREFVLLSKSSRYSVLSIVVISQFVPAIAYGIFLVLTTIRSQQWINILLICLSQIVLITAGTFVVERAMHNQLAEIKVWKIKTWFDKRFSKPVSLIYITWIMRREPMLVIATKIFSGGLMFAITQLYKSDVYDWRLLAMGSVVAVAGNYMMMTQLYQFENVHFRFLKNLPISALKSILTIVVVITILLLPEFVVIIKNFPESLTILEGISCLVFIVGGTLYFYSLNYLSIPVENFSRWILGSVIGWIAIILFSTPLPLLTLAAFTATYIIIHFKYFITEPIQSSVDPK